MFYRKRGRVPAPAHVTGGHTVGKFGHGGILPEGSTYDGQLRPWLKTRGKGTSRAAHETPQFPTAPRRSPRAEMSGDGDAAGIYRRWVPEGGIEYIPSKRTFHAQQGEYTRPAPHTRDESLRYFDSQPKKVVNIDANPLAAQGKSSRDIHDVLSPGGVSAAGELNRPTISPRRHPSMGAIPSMAPSSPNHALARKTGTDQCPIVPVSADMPTTAAPPPTLAQRRRLRKLVAIHGSSVFNTCGRTATAAGAALSTTVEAPSPESWPLGTISSASVHSRKGSRKRWVLGVTTQVPRSKTGTCSATGRAQATS